MGNLKVFVLLAGMVALFGVIGGMLGGQSGMLLALVLSAVMSFVMYFNSGKMALKAYNAQVIERTQAPELYAMVDRLRQRAGLPMPQVAIAPHRQPNAFATGRSQEHAVVCVTEGLMALVSSDEAEGVIAHELGHIKNRDMLLAPAAAMVIQFAITRSREFKADAAGAEISGKPLALASALEKLQAAAQQIPLPVAPAIAPLAQVNPLAAYRGGIATLFATHPPTEARVARLRAIAQGRPSGH